MTDSTSITGRSAPLRRVALGLAALTIAAAGCSRTPAEPDPPRPAGSAEPAVTPLTWEVPGSWTVMQGAQRGPRRAAYTVPRVGNDKEDAEVSVFFFGTGSLGDVQANFKKWFEQFDGDVGAAAKRQSFATREGHFSVELVDTAGTYKVALSPPVGPLKKSPVQMVKQSYRLVGAAIRTPDRGNWFFKLTGPDETVQAAGASFRTVLESAR